MKNVKKGDFVYTTSETITKVFKVGDTVRWGGGPKEDCWVGLVVEIKDPEIYDRCERIVVAWQEGGQSYEKESRLRKLN